MQNGELHNFFYTSIIRVIISRGISLVGQLTKMANITKAYGVLLESQKG